MEKPPRRAITERRSVLRYSADMFVRLDPAPPDTRPRVECAYCLSEFVPKRSDARHCSGACRVAHFRALHMDFVPPACSDARRETFSAERRAATGYGVLTCPESYAADRRVRIAAGLHPDFGTEPEHAPE